ncbi:glycosyltransferase family 4 protein [Gayadomonas joobiniege]|uniref:glycosyltransferase family 4 protein n=1 Tax=Gayadomonas joobiniege TaxID=1234606 RepID=UPI0003682024|nr:glycosyltransferase family 4 protein [Gayadomonas joobiniege]
MPHNNRQTKLPLVILGNSNRRFSGVTSTMLQVLEVHQHLIPVRVLGGHHLPKKELAISFWQAIKLIRRAGKNQQPVVFHARRNDEMIQALLLKKLTQNGIKILFTSTAQRHHSRFTKQLMLRMDGVISTCQAAANYLTIAPMAIIPHGINTKVYYPPADKQQLALELGFAKGPLIGIFGRVRKQKGTDMFLQACLDVLPKFATAQAIVCGAIDDSELVAEFKIQLQQAGLDQRVHILAEQSFSRAQQLMQACDIVTALSKNEGFGLTVPEAMACGCVVIANRAGAWPEIIRDGENGFLLAERTQTELNMKLEQILGDPSKGAEIAACAQQQVVTHFRVEQEAKQLIEVYQTLS